MSVTVQVLVPVEGNGDEAATRRVAVQALQEAVKPNKIRSVRFLQHVDATELKLNGIEVPVGLLYSNWEATVTDANGVPIVDAVTR
jgi:hypothetical protein